MGPSRFTSHPRGRCAVDFLSPLKIHCLGRVRTRSLWVQWQAHWPLHHRGDKTSYSWKYNNVYWWSNWFKTWTELKRLLLGLKKGAGCLHESFQVLMAVSMSMTAFWNTAPCGLAIAAWLQWTFTYQVYNYQLFIEELAPVWSSVNIVFGSFVLHVTPSRLIAVPFMVWNTKVHKLCLIHVNPLKPNFRRGRKSIILLEGSQATPTCPSDRNNVNVKTLWW
jgi:hypothetical protein